MGDRDRDAILARRALFISATVAGLACAKPGQSGKEPTLDAPPAVIVEQPPPLRAEGEPRPSWSELMAKLPPLDIPDAVSTNERRMLEMLAVLVEYRYDRLAEIWSLPECAPSEAQCAAWAEAIEVVDELLDEALGLSLCDESPETTYTYRERLLAHARFINQLSRLLLEDLDAAVVARANPDDSDAWARERERLDEPPPRVCLSCLPPTAHAITKAVMFDASEGQPPATDATTAALQTTSMIHDRNRQAKARLLVRGHASADEDDPEQLARMRAEAVAARLMHLGVPRGDIEVRSYGAELPVTYEPSEQAKNRRVDFEVALP